MSVSVPGNERQRRHHRPVGMVGKKRLAEQEERHMMIPLWRLDGGYPAPLDRYIPQLNSAQLAGHPSQSSLAPLDPAVVI